MAFSVDGSCLLALTTVGISVGKLCICAFVKLSPCLANFITPQLSGVILMWDWDLSDLFFFLVPM